MSTKYPQGIITPTPPFKSTTAKSFSGVWTLEQLANNFYYYRQAVQKSLRFRSSASAYLTRTPASAGNRTTWTWSAWVKRGTLGATQYVYSVRNGISDTDTLYFVFASDDTFVISTNSTPIPYLVTSQVFRDPSSWYHIVVSVDTTQATAANRIKIYINGVQVTALSTATYPSQNASLGINQNAPHLLGCFTNGSSYLGFFDGYMAEVNFIDGQALNPSYFGQISPITGVWSPAPYTGTYGTNGFYLKFTDTTSTTTLCYDYSGNSNNWTPNNISLTAGSTYDSMLDSPTNYDNGGNGVGNYAVLNPLSATGATLTNGNLSTYAPSATYQSAFATIIFPKSGKYYFEATIISNSGAGNNQACGIASTTNASSYKFAIDCFATTSTSARKFVNGTITDGYGPVGNGTVIGVAVNADNGTAYIAIDNTWIDSSSPTGGTGGYSLTVGQDYAAWFQGYSSGTNAYNFGQRPFAYTPPTGFKALNTQNLPTPSIQNGSNFMAATLYTGNGATQNIINANNGVSFQPDFIWIKSRSAGYDHRLQNSVVGMQGLLSSNSTAAEYTASSGDYPTVTSSGFTLPYGTNGLYYNGSGVTFAAWQWKAGGTAVTNTDGTITSQVSANTTAGFSVVTYTGTGANATVGHGLGVAPSMLILKRRNSTSNWGVYHSALSANGAVFLDLTDAYSTPGPWNNTAPTASVFTIATGSFLNASGGTYVAYCFAAIPGYSAFGSYTGNGSTDGPFVFLGFRPRYVLIKRTDSTADWTVWDTSRNTYNVSTVVLCPNLSSAESSFSSGYEFDILSNGFKCRSTGNVENASGGTYIYAAFAENPFQYSLAR